jgi:hypothetical protein
MKPMGLTMKKGRNKYQRMADPIPRGELMLIHECIECKVLSINRIAADDDSATVRAVFQDSLMLGYQIHYRCLEHGILLLSAEDTEMVHTQLYGRYGEIPAWSWK